MQDLSSQNGTFLCRVAKCKTCDFLNSATTISATRSHVKHHFSENIDRENNQFLKKWIMIMISLKLHSMTKFSGWLRHWVDVACFIFKKLEDLWGQGLVSIGMQSLAMMLTSLLPDILILAITVFQIWKLEVSVPFLVATMAANLKTCTRILISRLDDSSLEMLRPCYTVQFFMQLVSQWCCETSCTGHCTV
jgi:hypothetical protein